MSFNSSPMFWLCHSELYKGIYGVLCTHVLREKSQSNCVVARRDNRETRLSEAAKYVRNDRQRLGIKDSLGYKHSTSRGDSVTYYIMRQTIFIM